MNPLWLRILIFLVLNFLALYLGGRYTGPGVSSEWYANLDQAPWTPPGWVFGAAWTLIMVCLAVYAALATGQLTDTRTFLRLYALQWVLNVAWNPVFFSFQNTIAALAIILALFFLVVFLLLRYWPLLQLQSLLILPYAVWLAIATSLNAYIVLKNGM